MTKRNDRTPEPGWETATWEGARRETMRRWAELPVEHILAAQEEMETLGDAFGGIPASRSDHVAEGAGRYRRDDGDEHEVVLDGCSPTPLAGYLKALGTMRLVAEQADPDVRGFWHDNRFVLTGGLDRPALKAFLLETYRPTAILAPWNGGSGFHPKDNRSGIDPIELGDAQRFDGMRSAIATIRTILHEQGIERKPDGDAKTALLMALRAELDDAALDWLDAAVVLTDQNPKYPPLLGTGGNDGRLDFTNNFMQHLVALFDPQSGAPRPNSARLLDEALFGDAIPELGTAAVGQFSPGDAGGPNQGSGYTGEALVNSWDFVLMLEGSLLFAAAATRRLDSATSGSASYPFTVRPTGSGAGNAGIGDEVNARAEMWLPIWTAATGMPELRALLADGRVTLGRRVARDGLDFVRAVSRLGLDRGITGFQRYAFMMRSGKAYFATPLNRVAVRRNPSVDLIDELDAGYWLTRFRQLGRRSHASHRLQTLLRRLEDALFALALDRDHPGSGVQRLLAVLGEVQLYLARSPAARDNCPPVPSLSGHWMRAAEAGGASDELQIAAALASLHALRGEPSGQDGFDLPMRLHLAPERRNGKPAWENGDDHRVTWGHGNVAANLLATVQRRLLMAEQDAFVDKPIVARRTAPISAVAAWLGGQLDESALDALVPGLMLVRVPRGTPLGRQRTVPLPAVYRLFKPFFCTDEQLRRMQLLAPDSRLPIPPALVRYLAAGDFVRSVRLAERARRVAGFGTRYPDLAASGLDGPRLLAALLVPVSDNDLRRLEPRRRDREEHAELTR